MADGEGGVAQRDRKGKREPGRRRNLFGALSQPRVPKTKLREGK